MQLNSTSSKSTPKVTHMLSQKASGAPQAISVKKPDHCDSGGTKRLQTTLLGIQHAG
jgi:hypothetical protein